MLIDITGIAEQSRSHKKMKLTVFYTGLNLIYPMQSSNRRYDNYCVAAIDSSIVVVNGLFWQTS